MSLSIEKGIPAHSLYRVVRTEELKSSSPDELDTWFIVYRNATLAGLASDRAARIQVNPSRLVRRR